MSNDPPAPEAHPLQKEVDYYKRELKKVATQNMQYEFNLASVQYQLRQKRQGFALLSGLSATLGAHGDVGDILDLTVEGLQSTLGVQRSLVLSPLEGHRFRMRRCVGYAREDVERIGRAELELPSELLGADVALLANKAAEETPFIRAVREALELPYFVLAPVVVEGRAVAVFITGRLRELPPSNPPLDEGDLDTLRSLASLVSATIRNMRLAVLEEMDRLKTDFFANISHEFRTPITLSLGPVEGILSGRYGQCPEGVRGQLEIVRGNQRRLLGLINQILDLAKLEAGQMQLEVERIADLNELVRTRAELFDPALRQRGLSLSLELDPALVGAQLFLDLEKFEHVLMNLLSNAYKFTQEGGVEVRTQLEAGLARVTVRDSGVGIPEDELALVFDRFRQAAGSTSSVQAGTGIGLSFVKEMVTRHGGTIEVESQPGAGTSFHVRFPLGVAHLKNAVVLEEAAPRAAARPPSALRLPTVAKAELDDAEVAIDPTRATVLYVDDNAELRAYVGDLLRERYNVFLARDGQHGLERARAISPSLILSDLMMPRMNGVELCTAVRADEALREVPFVLLTAKEGEESKIAGLEEGADDYLGKPFSEPELLARVHNLLEARRRQIELRAELRAARGIQRALLPEMPRAVGADATLDVLYQPTEMLSGDFFDVVERAEWVYFYVADVTSHGAAAAQVTYLVKGAFQEALGADALPLEDLMRAAQARYRSYGLDYDVAYQVVRYRPEDGRLELVRANAPAAFIVEGDRVELLQPTPSPALSRSVEDGAEYSSAAISLAPGARLFLITDGCYEFEQANGRPFGMRNIVGALRGSGGSGWSDRIWEVLTSAAGPRGLDDDVSVLRLARRA